MAHVLITDDYLDQVNNQQLKDIRHISEINFYDAIWLNNNFEVFYSSLKLYNVYNLKIN